MKKIMGYAGILWILCILITSCNGNKSQPELAQTEPELSKQDTADVAQLATQYLEHLKNKEFDQALEMLRTVRNDSVFELSDTQRADLKMQYQTFPVLSYSINGIAFNGKYSTEVIYSIEFFEKEPGQEDMPNTMSFRLHPQKIGDSWHLGVLNR